MQRSRRLDAGRYLPHALVATLWLLLVPLVAVLSLPPSTGPLVGVAVALALSVAAGALGSLFWSRRPGSAEISFGELTLWGWFHRRRVESKLRRDAEALDGEPLGHEARLTALRELPGALEAKDLYTHGHSKRVEKHSWRTGATMDLPAWQVEELRRAAALHDVGKIRIPDHILRKPGDLTAEERALLQTHPEVGAEMVAGSGSSAVVAGIRHHHERWDGRGYPDGLAGEDIPLIARIIAVADAFDAMTSTRPYRPSFGRRRACEVLEAEAGRQFDPEVVTAFLATLPSRSVISGIAFPASLAGWGRRLGSHLSGAGASTAAPTVGTAGVAALVAASVISGVPATPGHTVVTPAATAPVTAGPGSGSGPAASVPARHKAPANKPTLRSPARRSAPAATAAPASARVADAPAARSPEQLSQPTSQDIASPPRTSAPPADRVTEPAPGPPGDGGSQSPPVAAPPPEPPAQEPPGDGTTPSPSDPGNDPQPERGRDCIDNPGRGQGGGNGNHCGG